MKSGLDKDVVALTLDRDRHNLAFIEECKKSGQINDEAAVYLTRLYSDGMSCYREVFHVLGKCFGAPKTSVTEYDAETDLSLPTPIKIADIYPLSTYIVNHRLDGDPMRNQFFSSGAGHKIDLSVSSIVTIIVGAQKNIKRAVDKITGKYYRFFTEDVVEATREVVAEQCGAKFTDDLIEKIKKSFAEKYVTDAPPAVLSLFDNPDKELVANLVRRLDKIKKPHLRLNDVWRVKCLFDLIPQARAFIERLQNIMPERVLSVRDKFYDIDNPRNYRDSKVIVNIGTADNVIPMEIICQVRTFFEFERKTHDYYAAIRENPDMENQQIENDFSKLMQDGITKYNMMICQCLDDLFDRVGWNILYSRLGDVSLLEGFPTDCKMYYPADLVDAVMMKLDAAVQNEIFHITSSSSKLDIAQEIAIFRFMTRFVLVSALPYARGYGAIPGDGLAVRLFNFVMKEIYRYYTKNR